MDLKTKDLIGKFIVYNNIVYKQSSFIGQTNEIEFTEKITAQVVSIIEKNGFVTKVIVVNPSGCKTYYSPAFQEIPTNKILEII